MTPEIAETALDRYFQAMTELQSRVVQGQRVKLLETAQRMAETTRAHQRIFLFGSGHSHLIAEEGFYRAGGLANVVSILTEHLMLHHLPSLGSRLERTPDLAELILERYQPQSGEMLFVFSNSGVNRLPVEMAMCGRKKGLFVVGISSFDYARQAPLSDLGVRLDQSADLALDNGGVPGDALLELKNLPWRVAPSSTVICALIWNCLVSETARLLLESGIEPPIFVSLNLGGAAQHNQSLLDTWRPRNIHL
ncbi:MAG TPA: SIS domain-containing protein [Anaerolineales bacterium]|nr:SIS domain-containing protein [Anaerolineales bacterium]